MSARSLFPQPKDDSDDWPMCELHELLPQGKGDCFVLLTEKQRGETRDRKPYYRCQFRDQERIVTSMVWQDSTWFEMCEQKWQPGDYFRVRCKYLENQYGSQIDIQQIRPVKPEDAEFGFDPEKYLPQSRFDTAAMFAELLKVAEQGISDTQLKQLVVQILQDHQAAISIYPAASRNHHAYRSGFLEHVLSVTKTAVYLADKYNEQYPQLSPPLSKSLVIAGAILHDIGKLQELSAQPHGADYTASGRLIGHILLGRDLVRDYARNIPEFDAEVLLRLEHIIVAHQNLPEWGSPISPHTPEALLVHYADDIDAKFQMMAFALGEKLPEESEFTSRNNPLRRAVFRGLGSEGQS